MVTWTWILIAVAVAAGLVVHTVRRPKKPMYDTEGAQDTAPSSEEIANAGTASQDRASSVLRPLPDTQTGQPDAAWHAARGSVPSTGGQPYAQLLENHEMQRILGQWKDIQAEFVDEPRKAVQDADGLVAELLQRLAQTFASQREQLESQWARVDDVSTEDLRQSLRRYHAFFDRLLAA